MHMNDSDETGPVWVKLVNVSDRFEFELIKGLLEIAGIPAVRKIGNLGGYAEILTGISFEGIDILVPEDRYEEAVQIIEAPEDTAEEAAEDAYEENRDEDTEEPEDDMDISE